MNRANRRRLEKVYKELRIPFKPGSQEEEIMAQEYIDCLIKGKEPNVQEFIEKLRTCIDVN
jgi:hypothetical protein